MDKESILELQRIDCNCNDCFFMDRDLEKRKQTDHLYEGMKNASHRINYGNCRRRYGRVTFIPNTCQLENQNCFVHRKDFQYAMETEICTKITYNPRGNECWSKPNTIFFIDRFGWVKVGDEVILARDERGISRKVWVNGELKTEDLRKMIWGY